MTAVLGPYQARMRRVLDYIDRHLDEDLGLDRLSGVAAFSRHHFHRQFTALCGLPVHRYVQLLRLKRASYRLAFRDRDSVTAIALEAGYEAPEAFARAFRRRFRQTPSAFRTAPDWAPWLGAFGPLTLARSKIMQSPFSIDDVAIVEMPEIPVAVMEHRGDPALIGETIRRFIAWRKATGLNPRKSATFTIFYSDPRTTPWAEFRLDLCAAIPLSAGPIPPDGEEIAVRRIPAGRCARLRVVGSSDDLEPAALYLYRHWLPASGEETRDFPLYGQRVSFFPDVPEHEAITELFLPLR